MSKCRKLCRNYMSLQIRRETIALSEANVFKAGSDQVEDFRCVAFPLLFLSPPPFCAVFLAKLQPLGNKSWVRVACWK